MSHDISRSRIRLGTIKPSRQIGPDVRYCGRCGDYEVCQASLLTSANMNRRAAHRSAFTLIELLALVEDDWGGERAAPNSGWAANAAAAGQLDLS